MGTALQLTNLLGDSSILLSLLYNSARYKAPGRLFCTIMSRRQTTNYTLMHETAIAPAICAQMAPHERSFPGGCRPSGSAASL